VPHGKGRQESVGQTQGHALPKPVAAKKTGEPGNIGVSALARLSRKPASIMIE
jgi:hypothetical protein